MDDGFEMVVGLRNTGRVEGVGLDDVGSGRQVFSVDRADQFRSGQQQQVVVAFQVVRVRGETRAAVVGLLQAVALDHRAHRAIEDQNVLFEACCQFGGTVRLHGHLLVCSLVC